MGPKKCPLLQLAFKSGNFRATVSVQISLDFSFNTIIISKIMKQMLVELEMQLAWIYRTGIQTALAIMKLCQAVFAEKNSLKSF